MKFSSSFTLERELYPLSKERMGRNIVREPDYEEILMELAEEEVQAEVVAAKNKGNLYLRLFKTMMFVGVNYAMSYYTGRSSRMVSGNSCVATEMIRLVKDRISNITR